MVASRGVVAVWDAIDRSDGYTALQALFLSELGDEAATSLDAPFAMGASGVLEGVMKGAGLSGFEYSTVEGTGRFASIDEWVTTEVRGWTLGEIVTDEQLDGLVELARERLASFESSAGCVLGMAARVATWST
jgi:hypothetical protein